MKSMRKKQLSAADIAARAERVHAISSVVPLEQAPEQALQYYTHLTDVKLRSVLEPQWGIYIAESSKVVRRALDAGHQPLSFLMSEKWADDLADVLRAHPEVPAYVGPEQALEGVTGFHLHRGALAVRGCHWVSSAPRGAGGDGPPRPGSFRAAGGGGLSGGYP